MPSQRMTATSEWNITAYLNPSSDTAYLIRNTNPYRDLYWAITSNTTPPALPVAQGHSIRPNWSAKSEHSITLKSGEYLWFASGGDELDFTITDGAI